ncbi:MAG: hypothetical protein QOJ57_2611, partial [Thermoleophilaceae bacterium]|nr:hypothetical protein [Thermoleophilaceae bacterium]
MSSLLASIARSLTTRWKRGLVGLIATVFVIGAVVGSQSGTAAQDFTIPGAESQKALDVLKAKFPQAAGATSQIVFTSADGRLTDAPKRAAVEAAVTKARNLPHVTGIADPLAASGGTIAPDGRTAFAT